MTNKELKKFSRRELLEILVSQSREMEQLQKELKATNELLEKREIVIKNAGSMAEAAMKLNHIFQDADAAAQQYLDSIRFMVQKERDILRTIQEKEQTLQQELDHIKGQEERLELDDSSYGGTGRER